MSRHRHVGRLVGEALDADEADHYEEDEEDYYDEEDEHNVSSTQQYIYNRNNQPSRSVAAFVTVKPSKTNPKSSTSTPPTAATTTTITPTSLAHNTIPHPSSSADPGFNAGDYADDDYFPEEDEEEYYDETAQEDDYVPNRPVLSQSHRQQPSSSKHPSSNHNRHHNKVASVTTLPSVTVTPPTPPVTKIQRSAAETAKTEAAVESLRQEKLKAAATAANSKEMNRPPSMADLSISALNLTRSFSPAVPSSGNNITANISNQNTNQSTPLTPSTVSLRSSSSVDSLSSHRRAASRSLLVDAEEKKEGAKPRLNVVVLGHVDSGKSTTMGHLMVLLGKVSRKEIQRYQKESKETGKASFHYAWVMDQQEEERQRGVTVDVGIQHFETTHKKITILDAPGHRDFIPNMISGTAQADTAILVVPAVVGEFEGGFSDEGQIKEHTILARSLGVQQLIIAINKLDSVDYSQDRYKEIIGVLIPFIKSAGFKEKDIIIVPISGLTGENLMDMKDDRLKRWYSGSSLLDAIDSLLTPKRSSDKPFRYCIAEVYKSQSLGITVSGRIDSGAVMKGDTLLLLPVGETIIVRGVELDGESGLVGRTGENIDIGIRDVSDPSVVTVGSWLCDPDYPIPLTQHFKAQILTMNYNRPLLQGTSCLLYTQSAQEPVVLTHLISILDKTTGIVIKDNPRALGRSVSAEVEIHSQRIICLELFREYRELGRFSLRRGTETVAVGIVTFIYPT